MRQRLVYNGLVRLKATWSEDVRTKAAAITIPFIERLWHIDTLKHVAQGIIP